MHFWNWKSVIVGLGFLGLASWMAPNAAIAESPTGETATPWEEHGRLQVSANGRHLEHACGSTKEFKPPAGWEDAVLVVAAR